MPEQIRQNPLKVLKAVKSGDIGQVTYYFEDGTIQKSSINRQMFFDDKGKSISLTKLLEVFKDTVWDRRAESFELSV